MTTLKDIKLKNVYRSGRDDLLKDFYLPALKTAKYYDRAVGYFSTSLIAYALKGISAIVNNNGRMRLIVGHPLDDDEFDALKEGTGLKPISTILNTELDRLINNSVTSIEKARLRLFMLLVATDKLELKFAFKPKGMYHEKIGIIKDSSDNKILFHGSANETVNAINPDLNFESIAVYKSWKPEIYQEYALPFEDGFEDLWNGSDKNIITIDIPSAVYERITKEYRENSIIENSEAIDEVKLVSELQTIRENYYPIIPKSINGKPFEIFEHQNIALKKWFASGKKGLFRLATGSGKTITAMYGVSKIFENSSRPRKLLFVVAVPYVALAEQWVRELSMFNMKPIKCFGSKLGWEQKLSNTINLLQDGSIQFASIVVVNRTLTSSLFSKMISRVNSENIFFVGDECHRHASESIIGHLPAAEFRMGLSATPYLEDEEREYEGPNNEKELLISYYGNVVANYTLAQALGNGILAPYKYHIISVLLTIQESETYSDLSREIGRLMAIDSSKDNAALSNVIRKRNKIISNCENKYKVLDGLLRREKFLDKTHTLFYVGEGASIDDDSLTDALNKDLSQLKVIANVIMKNDWKLSKFTSLESPMERKKIMDSFVEGSIDALVSMRVLDEGIDIPQCKRAFILASSRNSRQFVQRRGRILRKASGKDFAEIFDFVVLPDREAQGNGYFKKLVSRELKRVMDFVRLSLNRVSNEQVADQIASQYGIDLREL